MVKMEFIFGSCIQISILKNSDVMWCDVSVFVAAYLQDVVYKLSKIGQAIEKNDLAEANSVIVSTKDTTEWLQKVNSALNKVHYYY